MIPLSALLVAQALEEAMPLKPRIKVKAQGRQIPVGSYEAVADAAGKMRVKPKVSAKTSVSQKIASRKKRRWKPAK